MKPPDGIERLTPADAWEAGHRSGRESLALSYQHDKEIREAKEGRTLDRLDAIEKMLGLMRQEAADNALSTVDVVRRLRVLEEGPKYLMTDEEVRRAADAIRPTRRITRTNGPAHILLVRSEQAFHGGCLLMVPKSGYDSMLVNAAWTMTDTSHRARLVVLKTYANEPSDKSPWKDITLGYTEKKSEYVASPHVAVPSNDLVLLYDDLTSPFIGFRLETDPIDTSILASLVVTLYSHEEVDPR